MRVDKITMGNLKFLWPIGTKVKVDHALAPLDQVLWVVSNYRVKQKLNSPKEKEPFEIVLAYLVRDMDQLPLKFRNYMCSTLPDSYSFIDLELHTDIFHHRFPKFSKRRCLCVGDTRVLTMSKEGLKRLSHCPFGAMLECT